MEIKKLRQEDYPRYVLKQMKAENRRQLDHFMGMDITAEESVFILLSLMRTANEHASQIKQIDSADESTLRSTLTLNALAWQLAGIQELIFAITEEDCSHGVKRKTCSLCMPEIRGIASDGKEEDDPESED